MILPTVTRPSHTWSITQARSHLAELLARARTAGPQTITRRGRPTAVVVSTGDWDRRSRRTGTLAEFLAASPLRGSGLDLARRPSLPRKFELP